MRSHQAGEASRHRCRPCPSTMNTPRDSRAILPTWATWQGGRVAPSLQPSSCKVCGRLAMGALGYRRHSLEGGAAKGSTGRPVGRRRSTCSLTPATSCCHCQAQKPAATVRAKAVKTVPRAPSCQVRRDDRDCLPLQRPGELAVRAPLCTQGPALGGLVGDPRPTACAHCSWTACSGLFHRKTLLPIALPTPMKTKLPGSPVGLASRELHQVLVPRSAFESG